MSCMPLRAFNPPVLCTSPVRLLHDSLDSDDCEDDFGITSVIRDHLDWGLQSIKG